MLKFQHKVVIGISDVNRLKTEGNGGLFAQESPIGAP
jgi:hypothetical protein